MSYTPGELDGLSGRLRGHVLTLAGTIGERHYLDSEALRKTHRVVEKEIAACGVSVVLQDFTAGGRIFTNVEGTIEGRTHPAEIVIVGAHYDTVPGSPGADDNASGVAAIIELARLLRRERPDCTVRLVAFANEEPPFFRGEAMGSRVYARKCRQQQEKIRAMLSLEMLGYYTHASGTQRYPFPFRLLYPDTGSFIGFVGNLASRSLLRRCLRSFRHHSDFPAEGLAAPGWVTGLGWSDHWPFWKEGYPAVMVTDTAFFRNPHYHLPTDLPDTLDYPAFARVVVGLAKVISDLASIA